MLALLSVDGMKTKVQLIRFRIGRALSGRTYTRHQACILSHKRESAGRGDDYQLRIRKAQSKLDTLLWRESSLNSPSILSFLFEAKERHCSPSQTFLQGEREGGVTLLIHGDKNSSSSAGSFP